MNTRTGLYNLLFLSVGVVLAELVFGSWIFEKNNLSNLGIPYDLELQYSPGQLYDYPHSAITYTRDAYGLRSSCCFNQPEKIDILTVGGSTTDQLYISNGETWQDVLEEQFALRHRKVHIANAGVDGQSTFGHIKNFEFWFPHIPGLQPAYVLFYVGLNDFYLDADTAPYDVMQETNPLKAIIKSHSALYNLYRRLRGAIRSQQARIGHYRIDFSRYTYTARGTLQGSRPLLTDKKLSDYRQRLQALVRLTEALGARPVFVTQPSIKYRLTAEGVRGVGHVHRIGSYDINGVDYYHLLMETNKVIYEVAGDRYQVVELSSLPIWEEEDFYDWFHMTPAGVRKVGEAIFKQIQINL